MKSRSNRAQGTLATFELHTLGWKAFQDLCAAVASEVLTRPVQIFLPASDGGRDGAFVGSWPGAPDEPTAKSTIQCKFTSKADATMTLAKLRSECSKVTSLADRGLAHDYVVMTNAGVSGSAEAEIVAAFTKAGAKQVRVFGREWLTEQIRAAPRLRMMVPRLYGIGDLSQIIDERAYAQARHILSAMGDDLRCFVITKAHRSSVKAITQHGFVLLLGDPASGKSTIGASLAVGALDNGSIGTVRITSPDEVTKHWNPHEPTQFFWVDDAFGSTQYQRDLADGWNRQLPLLRGALKAGARFLFTSRNYIWEEAKRDLKIGQFPLLGQSQVIIDVQRLTETERAQILYNHIKMGDQSKTTRKQLKPFLPGVAANHFFLPETARRLGSRFFTRNLSINSVDIAEFVEHPVEFLKGVIQNLDESARAAIALIFLHGSTGVSSPVQPSQAMETVSRLFGATHSTITKALEALNGSLTLLVERADGPRWTYKHPTISDAFATLVAESVELIEIYVDGAKIDRLVTEVVCGNVQITGASVRVPATLYRKLLDRLLEEPHRSIETFLTYRCGPQLLKLYLEARPEAAQQQGRLMSELSSNHAANFLAKIHKFRLLPEDIRVEVAAEIADVTISYVDGSVFRNDDIESLLTRDEYSSLVERFENEVANQVNKVASDWEHDWSTPDPSGHMYSLAENLGHFANYKEANGGVSSTLWAAIKRVEERAAELSDEEPVDYSVNRQSPIAPATRRGVDEIFDDVDE